MNKFLVFLIGFILLAFAFGAYFSGQRRLSTGSCIECHAHMSDSNQLSAKARGPQKLIFFHATHGYNQLKLRCIDCHKQDPHTKGHRPQESDCLKCHTGASGAPSNACETCHAQPERLNF